MIYFDNAATTPLHPEVKAAMTAAMEIFGNPTSVHSFGREARVFIEDRRSLVAELLNVLPSEIFFTSGGTESLQTVLHGALRDPDITRVITTPMEHHAVMHNLKHLSPMLQKPVFNVETSKEGIVDLSHLESLLKEPGRSLAVLMHANNETGILLPLTDVAALCTRYGALFLTDTVQTMGKLNLDLSNGISFAAASSHKFHGPKGAGFLFVHGDCRIEPLILGGGQERNMRSGTENIIGIAGVAKALEVALRDLPETAPHVISLRNAMLQGIRERFPDAVPVTVPDQSLYTILNVGFPVDIAGAMLLYRLDIEGVAVSGGSACTSGVNLKSHVLEAMGVDQDARQHIRFSFSRFNQHEEVMKCLDVLSSIPRN